MIYDSGLWLKDLDEIIDSFSELRKLDGRSIMIAGAGGLICSSVVDLIIRYNETCSGNIKILAAGRDTAKIRKRFGHYASKDYFEMIRFDALDPKDLEQVECDYIINGAGNAYPYKISSEPVETLLANLRGQNALLELARKNKSKKILYISSSEVYGKNEIDIPHVENEYGTIDPLDPRNSYSEGKKAAENLCISYCSEYNVDCVIARPGHIYGPTASENDNRVSSAWSYAAARGENIIMKSDGSSIRSYCYCLDCASAILKIMLDGVSGKAYNISNPESIISIKEMAGILANIGNVEIIHDVPPVSEKESFNPMNNSSLDGSMLCQLGWKGLFEARKGFEHTVMILRDII